MKSLIILLLFFVLATSALTYGASVPQPIHPNSDTSPRLGEVRTLNLNYEKNKNFENSGVIYKRDSTHGTMIIRKKDYWVDSVLFAQSIQERKYFKEISPRQCEAYRRSFEKKYECFDGRELRSATAQEKMQSALNAMNRTHLARPEIPVPAEEDFHVDLKEIIQRFNENTGHASLLSPGSQVLAMSSVNVVKKGKGIGFQPLTWLVSKFCMSQPSRSEKGN